MHNTSEAFHKAVRENSPEERILLRFADGTFLSNEDIQVSGGVTVTEAINYEEELTIGACLSSTFETTIINDHRLLSGYDFGECEVLLGVRTGTNQVAAVQGNCAAFYNGTIIGRNDGVTINGKAASVQPGFPVHGLLIDDTTLYCIGLDGLAWSATITGGDLTGGDSDVQVNTFMQHKLEKFAKAHRAVAYRYGQCYEYTTSGLIKHFEYVPLGVFQMEVPKKRRTDFIEVQSYDRMVKFDQDALPWIETLSFPMTLQQMLVSLASYYSVPLKWPENMINGDISFGENPLAEETNITGKDVLGYIAGAACSVARMARDGLLELAWFQAQDVTVPMTQYFDIDLTERDVSRIDAVQIASPSDGIDVTVGGDEG